MRISDQITIFYYRRHQHYRKNSNGEGMNNSPTTRILASLSSVLSYTNIYAYLCNYDTAQQGTAPSLLKLKHNYRLNDTRVSHQKGLAQSCEHAFVGKQINV